MTAAPPNSVADTEQYAIRDKLLAQMQSELGNVNDVSMRRLGWFLWQVLKWQQTLAARIHMLPELVVFIPF